uniref:Uncharacterized protein n=1 Tax=Hucho hucho TaxID=62062 RepID=A0A4W5L697_9TELE
MMSHASRQHQEETRKSAVGKKILNKLVVELSAVVRSLEQLEEERDSLERQCFNLRQSLEQQEESNQQVRQTRPGFKYYFKYPICFSPQLGQSICFPPQL